MSESAQQHRKAARGQTARYAVLTVSDSRGPGNDHGGDLIVKKLEQAGHRLIDRRWVRDEPEDIRCELLEFLERQEIQVILTTGGTGVSTRDSTAEVVEGVLDKRLVGFGELFRMLSWEEIGSAAMLSRAVGGLARGVVVFSLPGSVAAVCLALERLIVPELPHLLWERNR